MFNQIKKKNNEVSSKKAKNLNSLKNKKKQNQKEEEHAEPIYIHEIHGREIKKEFKFLNEITKSYIKDKEIITSSEFRSLNRYSNILPFKQNLVKLNNSEINIKNYIHANYVLDKTGESKSKYIITQGPKENTTNDFWKMIERQKSRCIVGIVENKKMGKKCFPYWPIEKPIECEDYIIISIFSKSSDFISHKKLKVFNKKNNKQFECDHFHIFDWEDHSIIKKEFFLEFYDLINKLITDKTYKKGGPLVTHCSAGVGRSGTFVSCLFLIEKLIKTKNKQNFTFSIFNTVLTVKLQRNRAIKRFTQYKFLYDFLLSLKNSF